MIAGAMEKGLSHICFTEHMDMDYPASPQTPEGTFLINTDSYLYDLARFQEKYPLQMANIFDLHLELSRGIR